MTLRLCHNVCFYVTGPMTESEGEFCFVYISNLASRAEVGPGYESKRGQLQHFNIRELTKRRRRLHRRRYKTIGLVSKNNGSAPSALAFYILEHFFGVIS